MVLAGSAHAVGLGMVWAGRLQPLPTPEQLLITFSPHYMEQLCLGQV